MTRIIINGVHVEKEELKNFDIPQTKRESYRIFASKEGREEKES